MQTQKPHRTFSAFTLVELLVVIGIIALLISILLPVLGKAREAANQVKCAANMRNACQAMILYTNANNGWLPGPHTSGAKWKPSIDSIGPTETSADTEPLQNMDWMSPTLGYVLTLPELDIDRLKRLYSVDLFCPSDDFYFNAVAFNSEGVTFNPSDYRYLSYSAVIHFHGWPELEKTVAPAVVANTSSSAIVIPSYYIPKIGQVGNNSAKVYLIEGSRYVSGSSLSLNLARYQIVGGNFMSIAPWTRSDDTPFTLPNTTNFNRNWDGKSIGSDNLQFAWRHNKKMNLAFFDGHVELRPVSETIQTSLYVPKGTVIQSGNLTYDPTDVDNQVVD